MSADESGQMTLEMAVMVPVVLVVAVVVGNVAWYLNLCSRFDRVAMDMAIAHGVSPTGEQDATSGAIAIKEAIEEAMGGSVEVDVRMEHVGIWNGFDALSLSPTRMRIVCTMGFKPWPQRLSIGFVETEMPTVAHHSRSVVVDVGQMGFGGGGDA